MRFLVRGRKPTICSNVVQSIIKHLSVNWVRQEAGRNTDVARPRPIIPKTWIDSVSSKVYTLLAY